MSNDIVLDERYWDCECVVDFIHPNSQDQCVVCDALRDDQPNSRANEVKLFGVTGEEE